MTFSEEDIDIISRSTLFKRIAKSEVASYLKAVNAFARQFEEDSCLIHQGEAGRDIHLVLSGTAVGERVDHEGKVVIVNEFSVGELFGDMLSGIEEKSPVTVRMTECGKVLKLPFSELVGNQSGDIFTREKILRNLIEEIGAKYFALQRRLDILLCPDLRCKISLYLLAESKTQGSLEFAVPHSREEQSQILNCDRSALSRELSRMRAEGLIDYRGKKFVLKAPLALRSY